MNSSGFSQRPSVANLLAGALGGFVVLILGAILISTDVIDTGDTTREVVGGGDAIMRPALDTSDGADGDGRTVADIYEAEGRGVVFVRAEGVSSGSPFGLPGDGGPATGSGFVVDRDGTILTNAHVVAGSEDVQVSFGEEEGEFVDAEVAGRDPDSDLAVLKVDPDDAELVPIPLGDSAQADVGDPVIAIGNPFGFTRSVTTGIVSALQRQIEAPSGFAISNVIQTDASINPGNSGGPLLDARGRVIGINSQIATGGSSGSVGIGFAVPIDTAKALLPRLRQGEEIERAYLGVEMVSVSDQVAQELNLPVERGALILRAVDGAPADRAGLRGGRTPTGEGIVAGGDLLVTVDGQRTETSDDVSAAIADDAPGDEIEVTYFRGDERRTATITLAERPDDVDDPSAPEGGGGLFP